jgi:hypothetical protein
MVTVKFQHFQAELPTKEIKRDFDQESADILKKELEYVKKKAFEIKGFLIPEVCCVRFEVRATAWFAFP